MRQVPTPLFLFPIAAMLIGVGIMHLVSPGKFIEMMPYPIPYKHFLVAFSGWVEILLGLGLFVPLFRHWITLLVIAMLLVYLPIHVIDLMRDNPVIGSKLIAWLRLPLQFVLIWATWQLHKRFVADR